MKKYIVYILLFSLVFINIPIVKAEELIPNSKSGLLMEVNSGQILFEKNMDERLAVASMTKMVGLIIIMEKLESGELSLDDVVTASKNASGMGGSQIYLSLGEKMTVRDLIKGITMASANDATVAMAEKIAGSEEKFVELMNLKVKELGLKNTNFVNSTGLDEDNHFSSSYDMAIIAKELLKYEKILEFTSVYEDYLRVNSSNKFWLVNTNKLVRLYEGADGLKTGFTDLAGYCMAVTAKRDGMRLLAIVLGEESGKVRNSEVSELLDYGFDNYKTMVLKDKNDIIDTIVVEKGTKREINVYLKEDASILMRQSDSENGYDTEISLNDISLPLKKYDVIGKFYIKKDDEIINAIDLIVKDDVYSKKIYELFFDLLKTYYSDSLQLM